MKRICLVWAVLAIAVCFGCKKSTTVTGPSGEQTTVTKKGDKTEITVQGRDGEKVTIAGGERGVALPEGFPKDVPIYPGATVASSVKQAKQFTVMLKAGDGVAKVADHYAAKLKENGWEIETTVNMAEGRMFAAKKDNRTVSVMIVPEGGKAVATLTVAENE